MVVDIRRLIVRYNGFGKKLSSDERELLLFALYNESEARGGIAAYARRDCAKCGGIKVWHSEHGFLDIPCPDCGDGK